MKKEITLKHENRKQALELLHIQEQLKTLEKQKKELLATLKPIFEQQGTDYTVTDKTIGVYASIQEQGNASYILYKTTTAQGTIDWQAYALALGGTVEQAEQYRKASTTRTVFERASQAQLDKISK